MERLTGEVDYEGLKDDESQSIKLGLARAEHTFRFMSPEAATEALRRHRESVGLLLQGGVGSVGSRSNTDRLVVSVAEFVAHLHDDLPPSPPSELDSDDPPGLVTLSETEYLRRAAIGKKIVDGYIVADSV